MSIKTTKGTMASGKINYEGAVCPIKEVYIMKNKQKQLIYTGLTEFANEGTLEWRKKLFDAQAQKISINKNIYLTHMNGQYVCVVSTDGEVMGKLDFDGVVLSLKTHYNRVLVSFGVSIELVDLEGNSKFKKSLDNIVVFVDFNEDYALAVDRGNNVFLYDLLGNELARTKSNSGIKGVALTKNMVFVAKGKSVSLFDLELNELWENDTNTDDITCMVADKQGVVYTGSWDGKVIRFTKDGKSEIVYNGDKKIVSIDTDVFGDVYIATYGNEIVKISGSQIKWRFKNNTAVNDLAISKKGNVYVTTPLGELFKLS